MEKRVLIAFVLSAIIFAIWSVIFPPPQKTRKPITESAEPQATIAVPETGEEAITHTESGEVFETSEATLPSFDVVQGEAEEIFKLENNVVSIELSNKGALIQSLVLRDFEGDDRLPLDIVQTFENPKRTLPLQLFVNGSPDDHLYKVESFGNELIFEWADGHGNSVRKELKLPEGGYGLDVDIQTTGSMKEAELSIGSGMRNTGVVERKNRFSTWGDVVIFSGEEKEEFKREKLDQPEVVDLSGVNFFGFSDTYFLSLFLVDNPSGRMTVNPLTFEEVNEENEVVVIPVLQVCSSSDDGQWSGRLFSAPKRFDLLQHEGGGLEQTLDFGFFHPISVFFLKALRWIYAHVGNWGWSIVLLTLGIRIVLFPLMHKSTVSMRRMQKMQPMVKAIQEKYKKNKSDPQIRAKMNQETMALYKTEGVNPMGGCLPMLVQLPLLWALYTLFAHAIELRHAPFIMWILDLSAKDPLYITPVLMTGTMWLQQKLAPQAGDPQQQKIFRMMPLIFGIMFLGFPAGLVLYWLSNNVITIVQQEITLRIIGERGSKGKSRSKRKDKKR